MIENRKHDAKQPDSSDDVAFGSAAAAPRSASRGPLAAGLLVLTVTLVWMTVVGMQRPVSLSETRATADWPDMRIDVNRADEATLAVLPGIGPRLAERIVNDREANGPFTAPEDLTRVPMIGPRTVDRIAPYIRVEASGLASHHQLASPQ